MNPKLEELEKLAAKHAWTPCKHYRQCIGYCIYCWTEWVLANHERLVKREGV